MKPKGWKTRVAGYYIGYIAAFGDHAVFISCCGDFHPPVGMIKHAIYIYCLYINLYPFYCRGLVEAVTFQCHRPPSQKEARKQIKASLSLSSFMWRPTQLYLKGGRWRGTKTLRNTLQRLRSEEFLFRDFALRSFRRPEISAWAEIPDISGQKLHIFQRRCWALGRWSGRRRGRREEEWNYLFKFDNSSWSIAGDRSKLYLLHSSLPLCSLLLTNCEGSHSVRLYSLSWQY